MTVCAGGLASGLQAPQQEQLAQAQLALVLQLLERLLRELELRRLQRTSLRQAAHWTGKSWAALHGTL